MKNLDLIAEELFNKIRGRFPSVTIGDEEGKVTNEPNAARFFDFDYMEGDKKLGSVNVTLSDNAIQVMYSNDFVANEDSITRDNWYGFLKELRSFSKKRLLQFDTRNINKSNLDLRDYKFLTKDRTGDNTMNESKMYGTSKTSYQNIGEARIAIKHTKPVNHESVTGRIQNIGAIYIESSDGERFKFPFKHINGARAMARHVSEGGKPFDDFGKHIESISEELISLKKFKSYMNRSSVMAEGLSSYVRPVNERIEELKKTVQHLQKESFYKNTFENFELQEVTEVPTDVAENWIDQLTIRQFNEELKDVFPFVYRLVSETTRAKELTAESFLDEDHRETYTVKQGDTLYSIAREMVKYEMQGMSVNDAVQMIADDNGIEDPAMIQPGMELQIPWVTGAVGGDPMTGEPITRGLPHGAFEHSIENTFEELMGQFGETLTPTDDEWSKTLQIPNRETWEKLIKQAKAKGDKKMLGKLMAMGQFSESKVEMCPEACCGKPVTECSCGPDCKHCNCYEKNKKMDESKRDVPVTEFVLSMYDRHTGQFPKGETAVLTAIEKDYGEQYINPAKAFIEAINAKFEEFNGYRDPELAEDDVEEGVWDAVKGAVSGGIQGAKQGWTTSNFQNKAQELANQYAKVAPQAAKDPNSFIQGGTLAGYPAIEALLDIYQELDGLGREIKKAGGGETTTYNAMQMIKNIQRIRQGDQNALRRLNNQIASNEAKFIMDFVKKDIASISAQGESQEQNDIMRLAGL